MTKFYKYQGTGNDFIIVDDRQRTFNTDKGHIAALCQRRFGIGADGLILLQPHHRFDFYMQYFNSDGKESSMCGNGGRCLAAFAHLLGLSKNNIVQFMAIDGMHEAKIMDNKMVSLKMNNVYHIKVLGDAYELNTGSPHYVAFTNHLKSFDLITNAKEIRYNSNYSKDGINVNFIEPKGTNNLFVRTYERGVEDETYSCGTGVTACAIVQAVKNNFTNGQHVINIETPGGNLTVSYYKNENAFTNVWLTGQAILVFTGEF
jgi:diaminopimelate epimerase